MQFDVDLNNTAWLLSQLEHDVDLELTEEAYQELLNFTSWLENAEVKDMSAGVTPMFKYVIHLLNIYVIPVIVAVGLVGNFTSFAVFMGSYLRRYSSNVYLAALAWSDNVFLLCLLLSWFSYTGVDLYNREGWCQTLAYLTYVTSFLSVWYVVAFSIERYIAVCYPLRRQQMCTTSRAKIVVIGCAILSLSLYLFTPFTFSTGDYHGQPRCMPNERHMNLVSNLSYVDTVITFIVPVIIIVTCNIRIFYTIVLFYRKRMAILSASRAPKLTRYGPHRMQPRNRRRWSHNINQRLAAMEGQMKVTKMLLVVSNVFLLLNLPAYAVRVHIMVQMLEDPHYHPSPDTEALHILFQLIYYINFSINFFLYNLSGKTFRKGLKRLAASCKRRMKSLVNWRFDSFEDLFLSRQAIRTLRTNLPLEERVPSIARRQKKSSSAEQPFCEAEDSSTKRLCDTLPSK